MGLFVSLLLTQFKERLNAMVPLGYCLEGAQVLATIAHLLPVNCQYARGGLLKQGKVSCRPARPSSQARSGLHLILAYRSCPVDFVSSFVHTTYS